MVKKKLKSRILIIDDDKDVCKVLKKNLSEEGYDVSAVFSGSDGIDSVSRKRFELLILDMKLPDMHGTKVLEKISEIDPSIAVIVLTGYPDIDSAVKTLKSQAVDYIQKPFKISELKAIVQKELLMVSARKEYGVTQIDNVGKRINQLRKKNEMSLDVLAERTDLSKSFLSEVERKKKFPRLSTLQRIAKELGVSVKLIFKE
ncbi:MAG: response regulator [Elusimicrobiota bacterium]